ncbi:MAG: amidase [Burkholderiales bacterium]|nr:amidase [Burkholderiales bacterium]
MNDLPLTALGAAELARLIARRECTAMEVMEQHIARMREVDSRIHAMAAERFDAAREEARAADARQAAGAPLGPLHGVPVTVKESLDLTGMASTFGIAAWQGRLAAADQMHVARLRGAGAIALAKGNVAQALLFYECENPVYGRTLHPLDAARTPGGSSGGEAALVATGATPLALGTDIGGSIRIPAAWCGVAGFKPTGGRCNDPGLGSVPIGQQAVPSQVGPLARRVEDLALALHVLNGGRAPAAPGRSLGDWRDVDVAGLRVACCTDDGTFEPSPSAVRAVRESADVLRRAGAAVHDWSPLAAREGMNLFYGLLGADGMALLGRRLAGGPRAPQLGQLMALAGLPRAAVQALRALLRAVGQPLLAQGLEAFGFRDTAHYWALVEAQDDYRQRFAQSLDSSPGGPFDLILCPPAPLPALTHGATKELATCGAYACLYNLLGYPAGVVPVTKVRAGEESRRAPSRDIVVKKARSVEQGSAGLPVGVQVVARPWDDHVALAAMACIESAVQGPKRSGVGSAT